MNRILMKLDEHGIFEFIADEPCEIIVVCDNVPRDRLYAARVDVNWKKVDEIIGDDLVGHTNDDVEGPRQPPKRVQSIYQ